MMLVDIWRDRFRAVIGEKTKIEIRKCKKFKVWCFCSTTCRWPTFFAISTHLPFVMFFTPTPTDQFSRMHILYLDNLQIGTRGTWDTNLKYAECRMKTVSTLDRSDYILWFLSYNGCQHCTSLLHCQQLFYIFSSNRYSCSKYYCVLFDAIVHLSSFLIRLQLINYLFSRFYLRFR